MAPPPNLAALGFPTGLSEHGSYQITIAGADANTYTITATPVAGAQSRHDAGQDVHVVFAHGAGREDRHGHQPHIVLVS